MKEPMNHVNCQLDFDGGETRIECPNSSDFSDQRLWNDLNRLATSRIRETSKRTTASPEF